MDLDKIAENKKMIIEAGKNVSVSFEGFSQLVEQYELAKANFEAVASQLKEASKMLTEML